MAHSLMIFDFGSNEESAQQARQKVEAWKQGFRLGSKLLVKFDRGEDQVAENEGEAAPASKKSLLLIVRLDFSDHEKLSHQRWLERIPAEALFRDARPKILRQGDSEFAAPDKRFDVLD